MSIIEQIRNLFNPQMTELKLMGDNKTNSRVTMPKAPPLDVSMESLLRYSRRNELVYACIEKKAQSACDAELVVERRNSKGEWERIDMHPLVALLNKPNPYDDGESFRRAWIASENFAAIFYAEIIRSGSKAPVELYPLNPVYVTPIYKTTSKGDELDYYAYRMAGQEVRFKPEELMIRRRHGLGSIYSGVSAVSVALGSVDADTALTEYVRAFFNNSGVPSGILTFDNILDETEMQALQQKWVSRYGRGGKMQGGPAILDKLGKYESIGSKLNELDSDGITSKIESRICMAFGVPPILVGAYVGLLHVNQRASVREAQQDFWMNTMSPELKSIRNFLTWNLLPEFENIEQIKKGLIRVNWDMSQVEALQEDLNDRHTRAREDYQKGLLMLDEARAQIGLDPAPEKETGEAFFKPQPQAQFGQPDDEPKMLNPKPEIKADVLDADTLEKKTDELTYRRELTEIESLIDLKAISNSYDSNKEKLLKVILTLRSDLIIQASQSVAKFKPSDIFELTLTPPVSAYKRVGKALESAFRDGQDQITREQQSQSKSFKPEFKGVFEDLLKRLSELTVSRIINEIQTRSINIAAALGILGIETDEIETQLKDELEEQSTKPFELFAGQAANAAVNGGRRAELESRKGEIRVYEYSAILDNNLCDECSEWDGKQAENLDDLPDTPYENCLGAGNCRCFIIAQFDTEV